MAPTALPAAYSQYGAPTTLPPASLTCTSSLEQTKSKGHRKHDSRTSISSIQSHKEYIDSLVCPSPQMVQQISQVQCQKEAENIKKRLSQDMNGQNLSEEERVRAAGLIQRNYRGHRDRRMMNGLSLDASSRWVEAIKEARYRQLMEPRPRSSADIGRPSLDGAGSESSRPELSQARQNWKKIGLIARRAGGDEDSDSDDSLTDHDSILAHEKEARRKKQLEARTKRRNDAKIMDLQYFLEMVDLKHRYGTNLRIYHEQWKKADTHENFFYWLDHGEGRYIDCQGCSREQLDRECVRYLSKEERRDYLVEIDDEGRLCWAKNGARIDTTVKFKDSIHGIVPDTDPTPAFTAPKGEAALGEQDHTNSSSDSDSEEEDAERARADKYATPELDTARGVKKIKHVSAATIFNKLLRGSVKKNTWIFVADTSFRLYVGIKQSGAFQHSSFLHGSRLSAAGLLKVKDGRLTKLSPLSGHYRPPASNFRTFIRSLKDAGVDMSHVSISRSYAVLVGLETYAKTRGRGKKLVQKLIHGRDKLLSPRELAEQEETELEESESVARERRFLEFRNQAEEEEIERNQNLKLLEKLRLKPQESAHAPKFDGLDAEIQAPGTGPENAIAPEGIRQS